MINSIQAILESSDSIENKLIELEKFLNNEAYIILSEKRILYAAIAAIKDELSCKTCNYEMIENWISFIKVRLNNIRNGRKVCVVCGHNWLSRYMIKKLKEDGKYYCLDSLKIEWDKFHDSEEVDYLICDKRENVTYLLEKKGRCIDLYRYLDFFFKSYPQFYTIRRECETKIEGKAPIECIATGISYHRDAVHCEYMKVPTINCSNASQDIFYDFELFKHYYGRIGNSVKYGIIGLCPYSLRYDMSKSKSVIYRQIQYFNVVGTFHHLQDADSYRNEYDKLRSEIQEYLNDDDIALLYKEAYVCEFGNGRFNDDYVVKMDKISKSKWENIYQEMYAKYHKEYPETVVENKEILDEYINYLISRNIKPIILIPPYTEWYRNNMNTEYLSELDEFIRHLIKLHCDSDIAYLNLSMLDLPEYYFRDYCHLNNVGAIKIAGIINKCF